MNVDKFAMEKIRFGESDVYAKFITSALR